LRPKLVAEGQATAPITRMQSAEVPPLFVASFLDKDGNYL